LPVSSAAHYVGAPSTKRISSHVRSTPNAARSYLTLVELHKLCHIRSDEAHQLGAGMVDFSFQIPARNIVGR